MELEGPPMELGGPPPWLINMQRYGPPPSYRSALATARAALVTSAFWR